MLSLEELFCSVDDFCKVFEPLWQRQLLNDGHKRRQRPGQMSLSQMMTIQIAFHCCAYRNFKAFYEKHVCQYWADAFPRCLSYSRFVDWIPSLLMPLSVYLHNCFGSCTGVSVMDATKLAVCHNRRIPSHQVFKGGAKRGKTSTGWFYGFKLPLLTNDQGELLNMTITPGNTNDGRRRSPGSVCRPVGDHRKPVPKLLEDIFGKVVADRGYVSQTLFETLLNQMDIQLIVKPRKNMKNKLMPLMDKILTCKRAIVETIIDQLKNISQIEHSRHRSPINFVVNVVCGLIAYCHQPKKPALSLDEYLLPEA